MKCPICNNEFNPSSQFCDNCNFEIMIISSNASEELKKYVLKRQEKYKRSFEEVNLLKNQNQEFKKNLNIQKNDINNANALIKEQEKEISQFKGKVAITKEELNKLKSDKDLAKAKDVEINKLSKEIVELNKKVVDTTKFKELDILLREAINLIANGNNELHRGLVNRYNKIKINK